MPVLRAGVVSGLNRAIPSPVGTTIRGAIQVTVAANSLLSKHNSGVRLPAPASVSISAFSGQDAVRNQAAMELLRISSVLCLMTSSSRLDVR